MVGDDQVQPQLARAPGGVGGADAAIDRHHHLHVFGGEPVERGRLQPVAVLQPIRNEVHDIGAEQLERAADDHRRRDAVDVVVAVDGDPFAPLDRGEQPIDRRAHVGQPHGIVEMVERRPQEAIGDLRIRESANTQQPRQRRPDLQCLRQRRHAARVTLRVRPDVGRHLHTNRAGALRGPERPSNAERAELAE
jgi:hypothetical protein